MPKVSFVVPCFRLAHLLGDCLGSILSQTFSDIEVIVMDDCSPDDTAAVTASFDDPRVRYVRNERNLGHLRNYNAGIELACGEYVWMISADDRLGVPYVLERFVRVMDEQPHVGFVFCPAVLFDGTADGDVISSHGSSDVVFRNRDFLRPLLQANCVPAPAGMVRRRAYDRTGLFPLDLPFAGDWYLWLALALHFDVAYLAEPMVRYRVHDLNMTKTCLRNPGGVIAEGEAVRWRLQRLIEEAGDRAIASYAMEYMSYFYGGLIAGTAVVQGTPLGLSIDQFEASVEAHARTPQEAARLRATAYDAAGDKRYDLGDRATARQHYARALAVRPPSLRTAAKYALTRLGAPGVCIRRALSGLGGVTDPGSGQKSDPEIDAFGVSRPARA
jgi:glycosyltransferase involved in cell wall biosynthesis